MSNFLSRENNLRSVALLSTLMGVAFIPHPSDDGKFSLSTGEYKFDIETDDVTLKCTPAESNPYKFCDRTFIISDVSRATGHYNSLGQIPGEHGVQMLESGRVQYCIERILDTIFLMIHHEYEYEVYKIGLKYWFSDQPQMGMWICFCEELLNRVSEGLDYKVHFDKFNIVCEYKDSDDIDHKLEIVTPSVGKPLDENGLKLQLYKKGSLFYDKYVTADDFCIDDNLDRDNPIHQVLLLNKHVLIKGIAFNRMEEMLHLVHKRLTDAYDNVPQEGWVNVIDDKPDVEEFEWNVNDYSSDTEIQIDIFDIEWAYTFSIDREASPTNVVVIKENDDEDSEYEADLVPYASILRLANLGW